jgi:AcrR family transcriptional regulator
MDAIADGAGVAVGTLYRHHPTKAALVDAVLQDSVDRIADAAEGSLARVDGGADALSELSDLFRLVAARHAVDATVKQVAESLGASVPLIDAGVVPDFRTGSPEARAWDAIQRLLHAAQAAGTVRADLTPADLLALLAGVPGEAAGADVRDRYVEVVLAGIAAVTTSEA